MEKTPFVDRLAALVDERHSQVCLGLDPDPAALLPGASGTLDQDASAAERAGLAVSAHCRELIELAGPVCVAVKPQLACFERLGAPGWGALAETMEAAGRAGLLVIADGKRGDVPVTAAAYGQAMVGATPTPWGEVAGLGADAFTVNPLLGGEALDPMVDAAEAAGAGVFSLVRTSNPGAAELQDRDSGGMPLRERLAALVAERAPRLAGACGLSGMGAVIGATEPAVFGRLRELMPDSVFLIPGIGAQGGRATELGPALAEGRPASVLVAAARSIAGAADPAGAAAELRDAVWRLAV
ncbi:MAG: orotidine-5'-phosphate decarboxylase [Solirubrobacterales bacterium]